MGIGEELPGILECCQKLAKLGGGRAAPIFNSQSYTYQVLLKTPAQVTIPCQSFVNYDANAFLKYPDGFSGSRREFW
jgi:hypothetical protein